MKKVVIFLSFALLSNFLVATSLFAGGGGKSNTDVKASENSIREQFVQALSDVNFADNDEVYVYFKLSPKNGFELDKVAGENQDLKSEVEKKLNTGTIVTPANLEGKYLIKVHFVEYPSL